MSKAGKRRRKGTVQAPDLQDIYSPPVSAKKARMQHEDNSSESSSAVCSGGSPRSWNGQEVISFLKKNGITDKVAKLFEGMVVYLYFVLDYYGRCIYII